MAVRIARGSMRLYAPKTLAAGRRLRIHDSASLNGVPLLAYTRHFHMLQDAAWFQPVLAAARVVLETNSTHILLAAARASVGIAVLPRFVVRSHDDLVAVSEPVAENDIWLVTHPEFRRDPKVRATADFLTRVASGSEGLA